MGTVHCALTLRAPGPLCTCGPPEFRARVRLYYGRVVNARRQVGEITLNVNARTQLVISDNTLRRLLVLEYSLVLSVPPRILNALPFQPSHDRVSVPAAILCFRRRIPISK